MPESTRASTDELLDLTDVIRQVVRGRVSRPEDVEDLVQETLVRVAEAQNRLDRETLASYAAVTARNLIVTKYRSDGRHRRHIHRLVEYNSIGDPEELALRREENDALAIALARVPGSDRELLLFHEVDGIDTATLAAHSDSTPGGIAMRLARARALLRLEFVLALRDVELTNARCRAVLLAISAGDTRRQKSLDAAEHLVHCPTCAASSEPLVERRRAIAGWLPFGGLLGAFRALADKLRTPQRSGSSRRHRRGGRRRDRGRRALRGAPAAQSAAPAPTPTTAAPLPPLPSLTAGEVSLLPLPPDGLAPYVGAPVRARGVTVLAVISGGAWVGVNDQQRIWIEFHDPVDPSTVLPAPPVPIAVGQLLDFAGTLAVNTDGMASDLGFSPPDADLLAVEGHHIHVQLDTLVVR